MFRKTIQNIQTSRNGANNYASEVSNGYNTERFERYVQEENKTNQRKTLTSGQFSQLKKVEPKPISQLIIRQCDVNELNHYKKNTPRQLEETNAVYQFPANSSNKKQRIGIASRKTYDSSFKQPLEQIHFSDRQNLLKQGSDRQSDRISVAYDSPTGLSSSSLFEFQQQIENLKQYVFQIQQQQSNQLKKTKNQVKSIQLQCMGQLQNFANQISKQLTKQKQQIIGVNKRGIDNQRDLRHFKDSFNSFIKDNQQKIQSLVLDMNGGGITKKSRNNDQFGVDLKSSSHCISGGVGTSMSMNFQSDNINLKLYNEMSAQLQVLKSDLEQCKEKVQILQKDTKILQLQKKNSKQLIKPIEKERIDLQEVQKLIIQKFSQQRKKNQFSQKIQDLDLKTKDLYKVYQDMDSNIKGMNAEFTRVINGTVIKKQKMLEAKLASTEDRINDLFQKTGSQQSQLQQKLKAELKIQLKKLLQQKSQKIKIIKIRQTNQQQKHRLSNLKSNEFIYMLDQNGFLLDAEGNYIVETKQNGLRQKIKIQKNMLYLLQTQGIQIQVS